jgi:hypothetical protein
LNELTSGTLTELDVEKAFRTQTNEFKEANQTNTFNQYYLGCTIIIEADTTGKVF